MPIPLATNVDLDRQRRCGFPEVIYASGKSPEAIVEIIGQLLQAKQRVLATRVDAEQAAAVSAVFSEIRYHEIARTLRIDPADAPPPRHFGKTAVISAGTTDLPVAEEARETLQWMGAEPLMIHDAGVAGPHRLAERLGDFQDASAIVVVAGMEGALPSVVGGHVACPVFAVPTSVGYGANFGGLAALLGMLNSCASNVAVVNIDAGFKAAYLAGLVASQEGTGQTETGPQGEPDSE